MIDGLKVIAEGFAANSYAVLDDFGGFAQRQGVPLNRVRRVGEFNILIVLKRSKRLPREGAQFVQPLFLSGD